MYFLSRKDTFGRILGGLIFFWVASARRLFGGALQRDVYFHTVSYSLLCRIIIFRGINKMCINENKIYLINPIEFFKLKNGLRIFIE